MKKVNNSNRSNTNTNTNTNNPCNNNNNNSDHNEELNNENKAPRINKYHCLACLKEVERNLRCSKCQTALYCGTQCQKLHWPVHKKICEDTNTAESKYDKIFKKARNHYLQGIYI